MIMKKTLPLLLGLLLTTGLFAQKNDTIVHRTHEFGAHVGATTGIGLSYRYWPTKLGMQFTLLPIRNADITFISLGITGLYTFYDSEHVRFFGYVGNTLMVNNWRENDQYNPNTNTYTKGSYTHNTRYNAGFGPGFGFGSRVRFNLMVGYGFYDIGGEFNMLPTGEIGLYFRL